MLKLRHMNDPANESKQYDRRSSHTPHGRHRNRDPKLVWVLRSPYDPGEELCLATSDGIAGEIHQTRGPDDENQILSGGVINRQVLPLTVARSVRDMSPWTVHAGTYNVALVPDSLYKVCKPPCVPADTVKLLPRGKASVKYQVPPSR